MVAKKMAPKAMKPMAKGKVCKSCGKPKGKCKC